MSAKCSLLLTAIFFGSVVCEVVKLTTCPGHSQDWCTVHEVRIDPCKEQPEPCLIKKGNSAAISFDYTPKFSATKLKSMVYWANGLIDLPFLGMDSDACKCTECPAAVDTRRTYTYHLDISKGLPSGTYPIKWQLWNEEDTSQLCCFMSNIKLKK